MNLDQILGKRELVDEVYFDLFYVTALMLNGKNAQSRLLGFPLVFIESALPI